MAEVQVIKVANERPVSRPKSFPKMSRMYLELLENKDKVKPDLVNKEHVVSERNKYGDEKETENEEMKERGERREDEREEDRREDEREEREDRREEEREEREDRREEERDEDRREDDREERRDEREDRRESKEEHRRRKEEHRMRKEEKRKRREEREKKREDESDNRRERRSDTRSDDELNNRIKELLKDSRDNSRDNSRGSSRASSRGSSRGSPRGSHSRRNAEPEAPSLSQLESGGQYKFKKAYSNLNYTSYSEQEEEDIKRELIFKFDILKKSYPTITVPEFTVHSDLSTMQKTYDLTIRKASLDSSVATYKQYLTGGFMLVEFIFGRFLRLDMEGFTQQQMMQMSNYERLLLELGEKSYVPGGSKWPVELRLLFLIIINAAIFVVMKMVMKQGMSNINSNIPKQPSRKMKGPDINMDELPN